jgi:YD repeat-containing protein
VQGAIAYKPNTSQSTTWTTTFAYDAQGTLTSAYIADGRPRSVSFRTNGDGQVIRRDEADGNYNATTGGDPHEVWYRFAGRELGYVGNNGTSRTTEAASIQDRRAYQGTGAFRNGSTYAASYADFAQSSAPINSYSQGSAAGGYTVQRTGETLRSVAEQLWGDAGLWYKLAEANGLSGDMALSAGRHLNVPAGVARTHHNAATLRPYDADDATGSVSPTTPKPKKKNKCGVFGQILLAAVAIAVTVALKVPVGTALNGGTAAAAGSAASIAGAAAAGTAGGVVSQGLGVATGIQQKFSWNSVVLSGIGAGVGAGIGSASGLGRVAGSPFVGDVARGALGSAVTQGIGVATGLQGKFSWTGVAAAGIGAGARSAVARGLGLEPLYGAGGSRSFGNVAGNTLAGTASVLANAAARSALSGTSFGDNIMRALPDAVGDTVGRALGGAVLGGGREAADVIAAPSPEAGMSGEYPVEDNPLTAGEQAEIVVTARGGIADFRGGWAALTHDAQDSVRKALTEGMPYPSGSGTSPEIRGTGDIPGGSGDASVTLAGAINTYAFLTDDTFDDLANWLIRDNAYIDPDHIADTIDRLDWESDGNDTMLAGNIAALYATANPVLAEVASGLEDIALDRWRKAAPARQLADDNVEQILAVNPVFSDIYLARDTIRGRASGLDIGLAVAGHALPVFGSLGKGLLSTESRIARAVRLGREGEKAAGIAGSKVGVLINGRMRFPDEVTRTLVKEVKNVKYQGWTRQLMDYADLARQKQVPFELWLRPDTQTSRLLEAARRRDDVVFKIIGVD